MRNKNIKEILFYFCLIFIMVMSLNMALMDSTGMDMSFARMVLFTLLAVASASLIIQVPVTLLAAVIIGVCRAAYIYYRSPALISHYIQEITGFFNWLYGYIVGYSYFEDEYSLLFAVLYTAFVTLLISLIVYSGKGSFVLIVMGVAALSFFWFIFVQKARLYLVLFLFASIMLYSYQVYKRRLMEWKAAGSSIEYNVGRNWMICTAVIVSAATLISMALPLNIRPLQWTWLNDKVVSVFPFIADWRNDSMESFSYGFNSRYSFDSVGYKGTKLGGEVLQDTSVMMTVKTNGEETLYLRGAVKDRYSDNSWKKSKKSYKEYSSGVAMPLPYGNNVETYEKTLEITYNKLITSTIFSPYSVYMVEHKSKRIYADEDKEVYTPKKTLSSETYTVKSRMPYIDVSKLKLESSGSLSANELKLYTALAPDITERVKSLSLEITKGSINNFDKAKAIEQYLRSNFKYTLKPAKLPQKSEFTDHFLFEGKEGYCTYFATSMAILLRASNVPCRYVEGFVARYDGAEERIVRGTDAHAWVEVYFDDFGWVNFEPTPQYPAVEFKTTDSKPAEAVILNEEDQERNSVVNLNPVRRRGALELQEEQSNGAVYKKAEKLDLNYTNLFFSIIAILLLIRISFMYLAWIFKEFSLGRVKGRQFAVGYIKSLIWYLHRAGFVIKQDETLREFLIRVKYNHSEKFSDVSEITQILEKVRYSTNDVSFEERKALELFRKKVKKLALKRAGALQFFISLYIIGE